MDATFSETLKLFLLVTPKLYSSSAINAKLLHSIVSLLLFAVAKLEGVCLNDSKLTQEIDKKVEGMWKQLHKSVSDDWIVKYFSAKFGDPYEYEKIFKKSTEDIEVYIVQLQS